MYVYSLLELDGLTEYMCSVVAMSILTFVFDTLLYALTVQHTYQWKKLIKENIRGGVLPQIYKDGKVRFFVSRLKIANPFQAPNITCELNTTLNLAAIKYFVYFHQGFTGG